MVEEKKPAVASAEALAGKEEIPEKEPKKQDKDEKIEVPKKFKDLVEKIEQLSVLDLAELVKVLEKKFGVSASAPVAVAPAPAPDAASAVEEKSIFNIVLNAIGDKKIEVIKAVRDITQKGLKEAKDLVDAAANSPQTVKENSKKEEAEEIKKKLETAGAKVELK